MVIFGMSLQCAFKGRFRQNNAEFLTSGTPQDILIPQKLLPLLCATVQHLVSGVMPLGIVNAFEVIDVDSENTDWA